MNNSLGILQKFEFSRSEVTSCDISANYLMAIGLSDSTVRVLEWKPGLGFVDKFYSPLHYHKHKITSVRFSPKGVMLAFSSLDGTATLFDVLKGTKIFTMVQHQKSSIKFYEFTFDCTKALTAGDDGTLCFWDLLHHRQIRHFHLHEKEYSLRTFTLSPDSEYLLSMDSVDLLKLWYVGDIVNNEPLCILLNRDIHTDNYCCEFSPVVHVTDDFFLKLKYTIVTCGAGGLIKIWDLIIIRNQKVKKYSEHFKCRLISINVLNHDDFDIISVRFNSIGNFLVTTGLDNAVKLWEVRTGKCLKTFHEHTSSVISAAFSKDSALLITGSTNSSLIIWDLSQSLTLDSQLTTPCYVSHHCTHIKLKDYCIESAETNNMHKLEFTLLQKLNSPSIVNSVRFQSKDVLAVAGGEKTVALWEKRSDILMYEIKKKLKKCKYSINCMDISPCGNKIIFCSIDGLFILWDLDINMTCEMKGPSSRIGSLKSCKFLPDSKFFGAAGDDQEVYLWDTTSLVFVKILQKHENAITSLTFTPDSKYLISGCSGGHIKLQHLEQEKCSYRINNAHDLGVTCCDFSSATIHKEECIEIYLTAPKQNCARIYLLATSGKDSRIKLWGVGYSEIFLLTVFSGHGATVNNVTFSPSQPFIFASCSSDTTVRIWHTRTKQCLQVLNYHKSAVTSCSFSTDSTLLATGSLDKTVLIFNLTEQLCLEPKELSLNNSNKLLEKRNTSVNVSETEDQKELELQISSKTNEALNFSFILQNKKIVPHMFLCPITHEIMKDPVISSDGFVYERAALEEWFLSKKFISPITKESLKSTKFLKYSALKINIQKFLQENKK